MNIPHDSDSDEKKEADIAALLLTAVKLVKIGMVTTPSTKTGYLDESVKEHKRGQIYFVIFLDAMVGF